LTRPCHHMNTSLRNPWSPLLYDRTSTSNVHADDLITMMPDRVEEGPIIANRGELRQGSRIPGCRCPRTPRGVVLHQLPRPELAVVVHAARGLRMRLILRGVQLGPASRPCGHGGGSGLTSRASAADAMRHHDRAAQGLGYLSDECSTIAYAS
jgi:hypothetical protein